MKFILKVIYRIILNEDELKLAKSLNYGRLILLNWIIQRLFANSPTTKFSVNFTSKFNGSGKDLIINGDPISIMTSLAISGGCYIAVHEDAPLIVGEGTIWASNVAIVTRNHDLKNRTELKTEGVKIGKNCWLAKGVTILPGVCLGNNVTVGANSVVTKSFESNCVVAGSPARIIKYIN